MRLTFTITTKDAWKHQWHCWTQTALRLTLRLCSLPVFAYYICHAARIDALLTTIVVSVVAIVPAAALALALLDLVRKISAANQQTTAVRVAEIGENDFCFGLLEADGYYYHWTRFENIMETGDSLHFVLSSAKHLRVPKTAFSDPMACQAFLAEARRRWTDARVRENQHSTPHDEAVWPPPPRFQ